MATYIRQKLPLFLIIIVGIIIGSSMCQLLQSEKTGLKKTLVLLDDWHTIDTHSLFWEQIRKMGFEIKEVNVDYSVNDSVKILDGALRDFVGTVTEINKEKHKVKVLVSMFGRETPVELEFSQVEKI